MKKQIDRHLLSELQNRFEQARSVYIFGPRQSGKTTLARLAFPDLPYISLETPHEWQFASNDPVGFLARFENGAILDEIQKQPPLFSYLQEVIDLEEKKFVLTGSQNFLMMESISQSLAGRLSLLQLQPLSHSEILKKSYRGFELILKEDKPAQTTITELWDTVLKGGYPQVVISPQSAAFWFSDYVQTYLERDVRQVINVRNLSQFQTFLSLCASRSGSLLNLSPMAADLGVSVSTCRKWLSILEQSGVVFLLQPYHKNSNKRLVKSPKLYFCDTGILCFLLGIKTQGELVSHPLSGCIFETWVISEIRKTYFNGGQVPKLFFYRDSNGTEVDLIVEDGLQLMALEIKSSQTPVDAFGRSLKKFKSEHPTTDLSIIYGGKAVIRHTDLSFIPVGIL